MVYLIRLDTCMLPEGQIAEVQPQAIGTMLEQHMLSWCMCVYSLVAA